MRSEGDEIDVTERELVIGRNHECQLVLRDKLVSRRHARFVQDGDRLFVEDLESRNGVLVNERRITEPTLLVHGDLVAIGRRTFEVVDVAMVSRRRPSTLPFEISDADGPDAVTVPPDLHVLSARENQVFELIVLGHTQREIGEMLGVSVKTVETHRAHINDKLGCRTRAQLVAYAITAGVLRRPSRRDP
jgi:DNA-binding CsgD family transcriptional regulator